ncbi:hypothetical protein CEP51_004311 [Fusarium floridanum]|uniref:Uncharacterized protein n=1 Tax=Fusarium floridanum TaxID=1325733 RepID=A0A428S1Q0_9HYPO|nr:hypothetical protein CEP51_004311 [Fusarium floridanum]
MGDHDPPPLSQPLLKLVTLLARRSQEQRRLYGVKTALEEAGKADEHSAERILLRTSQSAWLAYYGGCKAAKSDHGFHGQTELKQLLEGLEAQPIEDKRAFAKALAEELALLRAMEGADVNSSRQGEKRRRTTIENYITPSIPPPTTTTTTTTTGSADTGFIDTEHGNSGQILDVYVGAPLEPAEELFHEQFWESIERIPGKEQAGTWLADVSMIFQDGHPREHFGCQMEIGIAEEKVAELAFDYFGVRVEIKDGVRSVRYPGGGKIEPDPSIKLRSCRQVFPSIFRGDLYDAANTSPIYLLEKQQMRNRTDGVSMTISNQAKEGAKITVFLGQWKASAIKARLYG